MAEVIENQRTITLAPETGSEDLMRRINKFIPKEDILKRIHLLKCKELKLYFMIGLPGETFEDLDELIDLVDEIRRNTRARVVLSINPFVPKPQTPFQWETMEQGELLKEKLGYIKRNLAGVRIISESIKWAIVQGVLAKGDRRLGKSLYLMISHDLNWKIALRETKISEEKYIYRTLSQDSLLPWSHISCGIENTYLIGEAKKSKILQLTPPCKPTCNLCGVCKKTKP